MPMTRAPCGVRWVISLPWYLKVPVSGGKVPAMMLISVDLPAPFSPNSTWTSPRRRSKSTPSSAITPGKRLEMLVSSRRRLLVSRAASAARDSLLSATAVIWATVSHTLHRSRRLHRVHGLEVGWRQHEAHVDLVEVALGDHVGDRFGALHIVFL